MSVASVPSQLASLVSASILARTLANAREARFLNSWILVQTQKTVRAKVDYLSASNHDFSAGTDGIDHQVFEMAFGELFGIERDETHQPILAQRLRQLLDR